MLGPILGPTVGGWLTENWDWRWGYFVNLPVGVVVTLLIARYVRDGERERPPAFDVFGFVALSIAAGGLRSLSRNGTGMNLERVASRDKS